MKRLFLILPLILLTVAALQAKDLYKVIVAGEIDAELLRSLEVEPLFLLDDGYLVLADFQAAKTLQSGAVNARLVAADIEREQLAVDRRADRADLADLPVILEQGNFRLVRIDSQSQLKSGNFKGIVPLRDDNLKIEYHRPRIFNSRANFDEVNLDSLIDLVSQDSVEAYLYRLEAFYRRLTGTDSSYAARDWIAAKFASFGYDSVVIDPFIGSQLWDRDSVQSYNVIATKVGSRFPDRQIVVGAHFDAVPDCPGVDDNGTGTTGVLEIARVLKDIETEMTIIFIAFDSEESWMWGSFHYADSVAAEDKNIIYMQNLDMIGHLPNSDSANLYYGPEIAYSVLWKELADSLVGIAGHLSGYTASDHTPFVVNGYDVTFVQEGIFSSNYHHPSDSTTYINFEYMTRMIKASLATVYTVNFALEPVELISLLDVGDGQSLWLTWEPGDAAQVDHYMLYYGPDPLVPSDSINIPVDSSSYVVDGLTEGMEYFMHMIAHDDRGRSSLAYDQLSGIPYSQPNIPQSQSAMPILGGVRLSWSERDMSLDFSHFQIIRDDILLPDSIDDITYDDMDPGLGSELHNYRVVAVDTDGNISDTTGVEPVVSKAATLREGEILAINRSGSNSAAMVDESVTGELMREALVDFSYDYMSDTSGTNPIRAGLFDLVDYGLVVIGAEGGRQDEIVSKPGYDGLDDDIEYYLSIGGKVIIFGRWGDIATNDSTVDSIDYYQSFDKGLYYDCFDVFRRVVPKSYVNVAGQMLMSDLIGAHSQMPGYPDLTWDSIASFNHWSFMDEITGVPCPSFSDLMGYSEVIYTYDSRNDSSLTEDKPVAWRNSQGPYDYVFFEIPLSFMERSSAIAALRQAVGDMGIVSDVDDITDATSLPKTFELLQNYPNPFNPGTAIEFYNPARGRTKITLEIFNILGEQIAKLFDGEADPGWNRIEWDGRNHRGENVASGIYFYRLKSGDFTATRKMVLLR